MFRFILNKVVLLFLHQVKSNEASSAYFNIRPIRNGMIDLEVHASSPRGSDAVRRSLIVKVTEPANYRIYPKFGDRQSNPMQTA